MISKSEHLFQLSQLEATILIVMSISLLQKPDSKDGIA